MKHLLENKTRFAADKEVQNAPQSTPDDFHVAKVKQQELFDRSTRDFNVRTVYRFH